MEFEKELEILSNKLSELKKFSEEKEIDLSNEIEKLEKELNVKIEEVYKNLNPWEKSQVARHPNRPHTLDYVKYIAEDFVELHGDRLFGDDPAIVGGLCKIGGEKFVVIGHQKGNNLEENLYRNFGMANPEGYRKALRLMKMAERFKIPVLTLMDTPGAYPGKEAEERGQGEAIARNLMEMAGLATPIISIVIGEGGSGGAIGLGVGNKVFMLENSVYSVISPEGCAAILFKDAKKAPEAAVSLKIDAQSLLDLNVIDDIIEEPVGGAHRNPEQMAGNLKKKVLEAVFELKNMSMEEIKTQRYEKFRNMGFFNL